ncbi:MAG: hypothetical protein NTX87_16125 [Planctomycetota bacterium]|nr:hypothetical protein [Planctomycetota bacterium]
MRLSPRLVPGWPKLAWVATFASGNDAVEVLHGPMVETAEDWCVEAVWAGPFEAADFDRTDLVYGSGIRIRSDGVHFVSSATGVDRLWYAHHAGRTWIANSLPALLATSGLALREDYDGYAQDLATVETRGIRHYASTLPATPADLHLIYFRNLRYDGRDLVEVDKPCTAPPFPTFHAYHDFLVDTARCLGANLQSPARRHRIVPMTSLSRGYDSPAVAVIARHAGCTRAATIRQATSLWRGSDSGEEIAQRLGLECTVYDRSPRGYRHTPAIWAAAGRAGGLNLTLFDYPEPLCLFFNGSYGDKIWDRCYHDVAEPVGDIDSMLGEFRVIVGMFHTVVPWWGIQRAPEIQAINRLPEMAPWTLHTQYDRPIPRRIIEEAGVPRGSFARRKANTSSNIEFLWPYAPEAAASFAAYLRRHGRPVPPSPLVPLIRWVAKADHLIHVNLTARLGIRWKLARWLNYSNSSMLFRWANEELASQYVPALAGGVGSDRGFLREDVRNASAT